MQSQMNHNFSRIPAPQIQRSVFSRPYNHKTTIDAGYLYPIFVDEVLPGDTMNMKCSMLGRLTTLLFPIMDNLFLDVFFFYVPNRLVWNNWERFNGAQDDPGDSTDFLIPIIDNANLQFAEGSLGDYFGLPTKVNFSTAADMPSALPFRAYSLIWNTWFRDQNLQDSIVIPLDDGPDLQSEHVLKRRGKRHDYFTSCLPYAQKGDAVSLPIGSTAPMVQTTIPVIGNGKAMGFTNSVDLLGLSSAAGSNALQWSEASYGLNIGVVPSADTPENTFTAGLASDPTKSGVIADTSGLQADLSAAVSATINEMRQAYAFQKILERDARGGTRYVEMLKSHFGVVSPDFRLQRPEYLGGYSQRVGVSTVPQTGETGTTPQANLAAYGQVAAQTGFAKSFVEHGYIIGLVNIRADLTYQYGMDKMWSRRTRYEFYLPDLAHLGEQAVLNKEIFYPSGSTDANEVFGYQERWAEMRYKNSHVTGKFRSNATGTLDAWHLALEESGIPTLNGTYIQDDPPIDRVLAVADEPHMILDVFCSIRHARPMPTYSVPGLMDRF